MRQKRQLFLLLTVLLALVSFTVVLATNTTARTHAQMPANGSPTMIMTPTSGATATMTPTITPTPSPTPKATATPCTGVNGNPWCFDFKWPGKRIYSQPTLFCQYFACASSFYRNSTGYIVECHNGEYVHTGGNAGTCAVRGGVWRTLYSH